MARIVEAKNPGLWCSILLMDEEHERITVGAGPSLPDEYNAAVEGLRIGPMVGSCGTAAYWNVPVVVENIAQDPLWSDLRDAATIAGVLACWSQPIPSRDGTVLGAMALYDTEPGGPTRRQMDGLEIAARMVGLAIERDGLEEQVRQSAKLKALGVLAGGIAHDFNNLLTAILGNAELAMKAVPEDSEARKRLNAIVTASGNATDLCNQMLAYAGRGAVSTEVVECNALVQELGGLLQVALSKKATLVNEVHPIRLGVLADRSQLRQVIMNLITADILEGAGYTVLRASDGLEAVEVYRREIDTIDCVLLDLSMPRLDGEEVFIELRKLKSDVCVLLTSGFTEQEMIDRLRGTGIAGFLKKPANMQTLLAKVAEVLNARTGVGTMYGTESTQLPVLKRVVLTNCGTAAENGPAKKTQGKCVPREDSGDGRRRRTSSRGAPAARRVCAGAGAEPAARCARRGGRRAGDLARRVAPAADRSHPASRVARHGRTQSRAAGAAEWGASLAA